MEILNRFEPYSFESFTIDIRKKVVLLVSKQIENWNIFETMTYYDFSDKI